jgi:hypothetical protein
MSQRSLTGRILAEFRQWGGENELRVGQSFLEKRFADEPMDWTEWLARMKVYEEQQHRK